MLCDVPHGLLLYLHLLAARGETAPWVLVVLHEHVVGHTLIIIRHQTILAHLVVWQAEVLVQMLVAALRVLHVLLLLLRLGTRL